MGWRIFGPAQATKMGVDRMGDPLFLQEFCLEEDLPLRKTYPTGPPGEGFEEVLRLLKGSG